MVSLKTLVVFTVVLLLQGLTPFLLRADESTPSEVQGSASSGGQESPSEVSSEQGVMPTDSEAFPLDDSAVIESDASSAEESSVVGGEKTNRQLKKQARKPEKPTEDIKQQATAPVADGATQPTPAEVPYIPEGAELSQGERLVIDGKGFSIKPPSGWIIDRSNPRISLSMMAPVSQGQYPSNINVARFSGPRIISQESAEKFADKIVKEFPATSVTIENYALRNSQPIQLADGRQALLFYTDFMSSGRRMMQAHVLTSSQTNHYIVTYTDVAENFEPGPDGVQPQMFNSAWESLASMELDSPNPSPSTDMSWVVGGVAALVILWMLFGFIRNRRAAAEYRQFADRGHSAGDNDELISSLAQVGVGQRVSLEPTVMTFKKEEESSTTINPTANSMPLEPVRGKKIKVGKRNDESPRTQDVEDLSVKAADVSSIEFSQDKFKREV